MTQRGLKKVYVEYTNDSTNWTRLIDTETSNDYFILGQANGLPDLMRTMVIDFGGVDANSVVITADSTDGIWDTGAGPYYHGLSEIMFGKYGTTYRPHRPSVDGDLDLDQDVDADDLGTFVPSWLDQTDNLSGPDLGLEDFERFDPAADPNSDPNVYVHAWWTVKETDPVKASTITLIADPAGAHAGSQAISWNWQAEDGGALAIQGLFAEPVDMAQYDQLQIWVYRHDNVYQDMYVSLLDQNLAVKLTVWLWMPPESAYYPVGQWGRIAVDLSALESPYDVYGLGFDAVRTFGEEPESTFSFDDIAVVNLPDCLEEIDTDFNGDCRVSIEDFVVIAENWLEGTE